MMPDAAALRRRYAESVTATVSAPDPRVVEAFATVSRELFLPPPPWTLMVEGRPTITGDLAALYRDVLVVLDKGKNINNGSPALHAVMLDRLDARPGQSVLHVGVGGGYYTAILAELVGAEGRVTAVEFDRRLADAARKNLRPWPQVTVIQGDGAAFPATTTDRIYVNVGVADPADAWLDNLAMDGVMVLPLAVPGPGWRRPLNSNGAMLVVKRTPAGFAASFGTRVGFVFAEGPTAGDAALRTALWEAFEHGGEQRVRSLHRRRQEPGWFCSDRFSLGFDPPG
jgi:protein-L-isoaspartate(D-aspartate) O-methyltransferase